MLAKYSRSAFTFPIVSAGRNMISIRSLINYPPALSGI